LLNEGAVPEMAPPFFSHARRKIGHAGSICVFNICEGINYLDIRYNLERI